MLKKRIVFVLGSNIGDRKNYLQNAIKELQEKLALTNLKQSSILENKALLLPDSPKEWDMDFLNLALSADINLSEFEPLKILEIIKQIENNLGRINRGKWGPREIDIDIILIKDLKINLGTELQIPHPGLFNRDFFLKTIKEIEPKLLEEVLS